MKRDQNLIPINEFKEPSHSRIKVLLKDKMTGEIIGTKEISRGELAKALQPLGRTCHGAINGKFVIEV